MLLNDGETDGSFGGLAFSARSEVYLCLDVETDLHFANLIQKWRRSGIGNFDFKMPDDEWATGDWEREDTATGAETAPDSGTQTAQPAPTQTRPRPPSPLRPPLRLFFGGK